MPFLPAASQVSLGSNTFTGAQNVQQGTITSSAPGLNVTQTWNSAGTTFTGLIANYTDSASSSASLLIDLQIAGASKFKVDKYGAVTAQNQIVANAGLQTSTGQGLSFGGIAFLYSEGNNLISQRNSTNAQAFRLYNTYTDTNNYERGVFDWNTTANTLIIGAQAAGSGTLRALNIVGNQADITMNGVLMMRIRSYNNNNTNVTTAYNGFEWAFSTYTSDPTTSDIPAGRARLWKNSTTGTVKLSVNDGGTIKSVTLA